MLLNWGNKKPRCKRSILNTMLSVNVLSRGIYSENKNPHILPMIGHFKDKFSTGIVDPMSRLDFHLILVQV